MRKKHAPGCPCCGGVTVICCSGFTVPTVLTLTDKRFIPDAITILTYSPTGFVGPGWYGCSSPPTSPAFDCTTTPPTQYVGNVAVARVYYFYCANPPVGQWRLGDIVPRCVGFASDLRGNPPTPCPVDPTLSAAPFGSADLNTPQAGTEQSKTCSPTFRVGMYNLAPPLEKFVVQG
jgi:hypothetical protein